MVCQTLRLDHDGLVSDGTVQGRGRSSVPAGAGRGCCDDDGFGVGVGCGDQEEKGSLLSPCHYHILHVLQSLELESDLSWRKSKKKKNYTLSKKKKKNLNK